VSAALAALVALAILTGVPSAAPAVEYTLETASLLEDAFRYFVRGDVGRAQGELALPGLVEALDGGRVGSGAFLYDRNLVPAQVGLARGFGAVPVRVTGQIAAGPGQWQSVRWEGNPGERVVWVVVPASSHWQRVRNVALSGNDGMLRYFQPYLASLWGGPSAAVKYSLSVLRSAEDGLPVWDRWIAGRADLSGGLAALVGQNGSGADWVYLVVELPAQPVTFRAVIGWERSNLEFNNFHGGRGNGILIR
jgi:hypothetical protein